MSYGPPEIEHTPSCRACGCSAVFTAVAPPVNASSRYFCAVVGVAVSVPTLNSTSSKAPLEGQGIRADFVGAAA
jgi:hypothetical protein